MIRSEHMDEEIKIPVTGIQLEGNLVMPPESDSIVIFSHGSGSSRFSPRNNYVAKMLQQAHIATLLIDLLTKEEDSIYENRFNIDLLTKRLVEVTAYMQRDPGLVKHKFGYFGASTGAASALRAAAKLNRQIHAVVSRGGRPDLAGPVLRFVTSPVLLIVGSLDGEVIQLNEMALNQLTCEKKMEIVKGATHLFEEPGKLGEVAGLASAWFKKCFAENKNKVFN